MIGCFCAPNRKILELFVGRFKENINVNALMLLRNNYQL